jgi:hypothetical protein
LISYGFRDGERLAIKGSPIALHVEHPPSAYHAVADEVGPSGPTSLTPKFHKELSMTVHPHSLIGIFVLGSVLAACSDLSSPTTNRLTGPASFAKGATGGGGGGGGGGTAAVVDLNGVWTGTEQVPASSTVPEPSALQFTLIEDASGNLTGQAPFSRGALTGTAKSDGSFSAKTTEGFSISGKAASQVCGDGSAATVLTGTLRVGILGGAGFTATYSVDNCPVAPPAA